MEEICSSETLIACINIALGLYSQNRKPHRGISPCFISSCSPNPPYPPLPPLTIAADTDILACLHRGSCRSILFAFRSSFPSLFKLYMIQVSGCDGQFTAYCSDVHCSAFRASNWYIDILPAYRKHCDHSHSPVCPTCARCVTVHCTSTSFHLQNAMGPSTQETLMSAPW
jgi:hypothetical protein